MEPQTERERERAVYKTASRKLLEIIRAHFRGEPIIRQIAERIEARERSRDRLAPKNPEIL